MSRANKTFLAACSVFFSYRTFTHSLSYQEPLSGNFRQQKSFNPPLPLAQTVPSMSSPEFSAP